MRITFLIGNGFDLNLKLKTHFKDMYPSYLEKDSPSEAVRRFKDELRISAPDGYATWGDFEMSMARYAKNCLNEQEWLLCIRDFKRHMVEHLNAEQEDFDQTMSNIPSERLMKVAGRAMGEYLDGFCNGLTPNATRLIKKHKKQDYAFIVFNYTSVFDFLLTQRARYLKIFSELDNMIHIHGTLTNNDIALGVNDLMQIDGAPFELSDIAKRAFLKPTFNKQYDEARVIKAQEMIASSDVICIFGMALGESDEMWREALEAWLLFSPDNQLVYYMYDDIDRSKWTIDEIMDNEDKMRKIVLSKIFDNEAVKQKVSQQVHVPIKHTMFDFEALLNPNSRKVIENKLPIGI